MSKPKKNKWVGKFVVDKLSNRIGFVVDSKKKKKKERYYVARFYSNSKEEWYLLRMPKEQFEESNDSILNRKIGY